MKIFRYWIKQFLNWLMWCITYRRIISWNQGLLVQHPHFTKITQADIDHIDKLIKIYNLNVNQ